MKHNVKNYLPLFFVFLLYSFVSVLAKVASAQDTLIEKAVFIGLEFALLGVYAILWQQILKKFQLTVAMSCKGITVIYAMVWSVLLFQEPITVWNIVGSILVIIGIWVVSTDD